MLTMCRPIFGTGKAVVLGSEFCVDKVNIELEPKWVYARDLIKKRCYLTKEVLGYLIDTNFQDKEVGAVEMIEAIA